MKQASQNKPDFIIIGAMKCATSTMHDQLSMHESFFMTNPKEPNFFSDDEIYTKGIKWYESLYEGAEPGQLKGESSTHYTKLPRHPETIKRMSSFCPDVKCLYMMRHPVDRFVSHYIHEWTQGVISCDIDEAVSCYPELIEYSRYDMQLEPYLNTFGYPSVIPIFTERLWNDPQSELQTVFDFLSVNEKPVWHPNIRSNVSAERLRVCTWRDAIVNNDIGRFLRRTFVPKRVRRAIRSLWTMKKRPELSHETLQQIIHIFDKDLEKLGTKLDLELNCENFKQTVVSQKKISWADN